MKRLLLVIDFQIDFVCGTLGFDGAQRLDERIAEKIIKYRNNGWDVAFTFDTHDKDYLTTLEGQKLPITHCIKDTQGWQLYGKVASLIRDTDKRFIKPTFGSIEMMNYLHKSDYKEIELVGLVTNICVISNAVLVKTALPETEIVVDALCVASFDNSLHEKALDVMEGLQISIKGRDCFNK